MLPRRRRVSRDQKGQVLAAQKTAEGYQVLVDVELQGVTVVFEPGSICIYLGAGTGNTI